MSVPLLGKIIQGAYQGGKRLIPQRRFAPASLLDTATNPKTYQGLAQSASDTLGRALPPQFRGAGFQNVPAGALSALDDAAAAPFAGPVRQQILQKASKDFARKAGSGTTRVPVRPTGGQPVPPVTLTGGANPIVGPIPSRLSPRGGIPPQARVPVIPKGGQPVNISSPERYTTLKDIPAGPLTNAQKLGIVSAATGVTGTGTVLATNGGQSIEDRLNQVGPALDNFVGGLNFPGKQMLSNFGREQEKRGLGSVLDLSGGLLGPFVSPLMPNSQVEASSRAANLPRSVNTNLAAYDAGVTLPNVSSAGNIGSFRPVIQARNTGAGDDNSNDAPLPPPPTDLPASAEETPAMMDPYAYNLAVYGQGRTAAGTQEERKAVQNLGTAINQRLFPKLNNQTSFNPLMARTFPDRYPQSLEAFIEERGIQKPNSMTEADSATALANVTNAVEPMLTPEVAEQLRLLRQQGRL